LDFEVAGGLKFGIGWLNEDNGKANGGYAGDNGPQGKAFSMRPSLIGSSSSPRMSNYTYHANQGGQYGDHFDYGEPGELTFGEWHRFDHHIEMNTPGQRDGQQQTWVDGQLAVDKNNIEYRGSSYDFGVGAVWFNCWWGGNDPAPTDQSNYFGELRISTSGPVSQDLE
jgi:hypothetical protein